MFLYYCSRVDAGGSGQCDVFHASRTTADLECFRVGHGRLQVRLLDTSEERVINFLRCGEQRGVLLRIFVAGMFRCFCAGAFGHSSSRRGLELDDLKFCKAGETQWC